MSTVQTYRDWRWNFNYSSDDILDGRGVSVKGPLQSHLRGPKREVYIEATDIWINTEHGVYCLELSLWGCQRELWLCLSLIRKAMSLICCAHHMQYCSDSSPGSGGGGWGWMLAFPSWLYLNGGWDRCLRAWGIPLSAHGWVLILWLWLLVTTDHMQQHWLQRSEVARDSSHWGRRVWVTLSCGSP